MRLRKEKDLRNALARIVLLLILLLAAAAWRGQIFGFRTDGTSANKANVNLSLEQCKAVFEEAEEVKKKGSNIFKIYNRAGKLLGIAQWDQGQSGYGGRVPLFVFTDRKKIIKTVLLDDNYESKDYLKSVFKTKLLSKWNGVKTSKIAEHEVDAVSGATLSSEAIILGVRALMSDGEIKTDFDILTIKNIVSLALLLILTFAYFKPKALIKYQTILQVLSISIFGFWLTHFLSLGQIISWLSNGINWKIQLVIAVVFILSTVLPLLFGKAFYCFWVCPFGAAQELCGKALKSKLKVPSKTLKRFTYTREIVFYTILFALWTGYAFDLALVEPFAAFSVVQTGYFTLGLAGLFLVISLFVPRPWCKFFCPTGYILEWFRK